MFVINRQQKKPTLHKKHSKKNAARLKIKMVLQNSITEPNCVIGVNFTSVKLCEAETLNYSHSHREMTDEIETKTKTKRRLGRASLGT